MTAAAAQPTATAAARSATLRPTPVVLACIDIGSNTTRLLVAEVGAAGVRPLRSERAFTRLGAATAGGAAVPADRIAALGRVVAAQAGRGRALGARKIAAVATAAVRSAPNAAEIAAELRRAAGVDLRVLSGEDEARLSFAGATHELDGDGTARVAVVDVGGGSSEIAVGTPRGRVEWWRSLAVGSGELTDRLLPADPPTAGQLDAVRAEVERACADLDPPPCERALAVGGTATSLARMLGSELAPAALERCVSELASMPSARAAQRFGLDEQRARLLPAGMLALAALARALGVAPAIAAGGLREGVLAELARS